MKRILTSASLVAMGAVGVQAAYDPGQSSVQTQKPWSVSASLRGFYDDNYTTSPSSVARDSFGIEVSPSASLNWTQDQTYLGLSYTYGMRWYEDRKKNSADHSHQVDAKLSHRFTERYKVDLSDSFVVAQEPEVLDPTIGVPLRTDGNNIRNLAKASLDATLTELLSADLTYSNTLYDYDQKGAGSRSALLDRIENLISLDLRWQALPNTVGILGYQYGMVDHTSNDPLFPFLAPANPLNDPGVRDTQSHYIFVGVDQQFTPQLVGSLRVGAQITQFDSKAPTDDTVSPYVDGSATWTYNPGSYAQLGVRHARTQTDLAYSLIAFNPASPDPTVDAETTTIYGSINHRITPKLVGSILGQYQIAEYQGGFANNSTDNFLLLGANLNYEINKFMSAEIGYNYDRLDSDVPFRGYTRNRVYLGIKATY
jgi:hypothetical protein